MALLAILAGIVLICAMFIPPWLVRNVQVGVYPGTIIAVMVLGAMLALSFLGKELIALGIETFRETVNGR
jgi:hypothetical protein